MDAIFVPEASELLLIRQGAKRSCAVVPERFTTQEREIVKLAWVILGLNRLDAHQIHADPIQ